jgi:hypothetical protein
MCYSCKQVLATPGLQIRIQHFLIADTDPDPDLAPDQSFDDEKMQKN